MTPRLTNPMKFAAVAAMSFAALASSCTTGNYDSSSNGGRSLTGANSGDNEMNSAVSTEDGARPVANQPIAGATKVAMAFPTGDRSTSAVLLEKEVPAEVIRNTQFEYRILVSNLTDRALESVVVTDSIDAGFSLDSTEPAASVSGGVASWDLGVLAPRSTKTLSVLGKATDMGSITSCAAVSYKSKLCSTTTVVSPALSVALSAPTEGLACDPFDLTVTVTNEGTGDARGVRVVDELPEGLTTLAGQRRIVMDFGTLSSAQSKEKTVKLKAAGSGAYVHSANAEAKGGLTSAAPEVTTLMRAPSLTLSMGTTDKVFVTRPIQSTLKVSNTGDAVSDETVVRVALPADVMVASASEGGQISSDAITWTLGDLEPGASKDLSYESSSKMGGTLVTEAKASGRCADEVIATSRTTVEGIAALLLEVADESDIILVGEPVTYMIDITNQGSAPDTLIVIEADVEEGVEIVSTKGDVSATIVGRNVKFDPIPSLAPGEEVRLEVTVKSSKQFDSRFNVKLTSTQKTRPVAESESTNFLD